MPRAPKPIPKPKSNRTPPRRGKTTERGYGWEHQQQRARLLKAHPLCQRCAGDWSAHLHHRDRNPFNRSPANLEALCERCHQAEHAPAK